MSTSRSLNKVILIGNLTRNPVLKTTATNATVCTFGLATNSVWKDSQNNVQERTEFHNIVAWNKLGEICAQLLAVGMFVYVEGELRTRTWTDENGVRHYRTEIKAQDMKILDKKGKEGVGVDKAKEENTAEPEGFIADDQQLEEAPVEEDSVPAADDDTDDLF